MNLIAHLKHIKNKKFFNIIIKLDLHIYSYFSKALKEVLSRNYLITKTEKYGFNKLSLKQL